MLVIVQFRVNNIISQNIEWASLYHDDLTTLDVSSLHVADEGSRDSSPNDCQGQKVRGGSGTSCHDLRVAY
jgi:hypothetical protein